MVSDPTLRTHFPEMYNVRIVAIRENPSIGKVFREKLPGPKDTRVLVGPGVLPVACQTMD